MTEFLKNWKERRRTAFIRREGVSNDIEGSVYNDSIRAYPFGIYAQHFQCAHGHTFSTPFIDDLCP